MTDARAVGIDLGGTAIKAGAISGTGTISNGGRLPSTAGRARCAARPHRGDRALGAEDRLGLGSPGVFDRGRGTILEAPNLRFLERIALCESSGAASTSPRTPSASRTTRTRPRSASSGSARERERRTSSSSRSEPGSAAVVLGGRLFTGPGAWPARSGTSSSIGRRDLRLRSSRMPRTLASATAARRRAAERRLPRTSSSSRPRPGVRRTRARAPRRDRRGPRAGPRRSR